MKSTNWQSREAARIGNSRQIEAVVTDWVDDLPVIAYDTASERRAREIRRENIRRTAAAA
jgi:hypothetical protein